MSPGDFVRAELDPEVFKAMHEESVGWSDQMMEVGFVCVWGCGVCVRCGCGCGCICCAKVFHSSQ